MPPVSSRLHQRAPAAYAAARRISMSVRVIALGLAPVVRRLGNRHVARAVGRRSPQAETRSFSVTRA